MGATFLKVVRLAFNSCMSQLDVASIRFTAGAIFFTAKTI